VIDELHIRALGVIEEATVRLSPGLTVVTGETGAGKTMVVTALQLLLGARADTSLVRAGAPAALAEARVSPVPATAADWAEGDDELVVSREIPADGRSRARINGRLAAVSALTDALGPTVEVHAQHEHVRLARPDVQRRLLDRFAGAGMSDALAGYRAAYDSWRAAARRAEQLSTASRERARDVDRYRYELDEIAAAAIDPDTDHDLDRRIELLEHAEEVAELVRQAAVALGSDGAGEPLGVALAALRRLPVDDDELTAAHQRVTALVEEATDLAAELRGRAESVDADPAALTSLRERQMVLRGLCRKYGDDLEEVLAYERRAAAELARLEADEAEGSDIEQQVAELAAAVDAAAADVTARRQVAAGDLGEVVAGHLADLGMPHARFRVDVAPLEEPGADGADRVTYLLAANPGEPERPVAQAASGGERSRVALAIEVALADVDDAEVLVFDEVDAGIGGATALAVGEKLARLADGGAGRQVLCVTHLAQLAAFADVHHVVEKSLVDGRTVTTAREVGADERVGELARMLGGDADAEAGRAHAAALLEDASSRRVVRS
jgi:DNA repair protein RecN (Recombination protein N)